jgi:hypothetical protein
MDLGTLASRRAWPGCKQGGRSSSGGAKFLKYAMVEGDVVAVDSVHRRVGEVIVNDAMHR